MNFFDPTFSTTNTMRAAVLAAPGRIEIRETPRPVAAPGEVLVRIEGCGICASNLPAWEGRPWFRYPFSPGDLGHEAWGRVEAVGAREDEAWLNRRVAALSYRAYAEYDVAAAEAIVALPPALDGQPFPAEPLACAYNIFERSGIEAGADVAIVGIGFLGALLCDMATRAKARVLAIGRRPSALAAVQTRAAQVIPLEDSEAVVEAVRKATNGKFCDVVIEATGKQEPLDLAARLTRERGRLVIAGYHQDGPRTVDLQLWNWRGLDVINAHERDPQTYVRGMHAAVEAASNGALSLGELLTHHFPLENLGEGLAASLERPAGFMKAFVSYD
jgi:2-desacetyl-2-hydroxyethyl bacteriochlorophyllide A dehydrogenase